jgi:hypothetical protein
MNAIKNGCRIFLPALAALAFAAAAHAAPAAAAKKAAAAPAAPAGEAIEYAALEQRIGDEVIVETTMNTVRRGTLVKYTNPTLTLRVGAAAGGYDLSIPHETVRSLRVIPKAGATPQADAKQGTR